MRDVAGLVLTGGASRRFGVDKATLLVEGERLADRTRRVLGEVVSPVLEVGPGFTGPDAVREEPPGGGPLVAVAAGAAALDAAGASAWTVVVTAVDLPCLEVATIDWLARHAADETVVPLVDGVAQSLCARYTVDALQIASELVAGGERSLRALLEVIPVHYADESEWIPVTTPRAFADVDTPDDAVALGVEIPTAGR